MKLKVSKSFLNGEIAVPGSKSHTIRAVAFATMAEGVSVIEYPLISGDTLSSLVGARSLGASVVQKDPRWIISGNRGRPRISQDLIDLGNSGTSLRIFTALAATGSSCAEFDGDASLRTRLMQPLLEALEKLGAECNSHDGKCPIAVKGPLKGGKTFVDGQSSQFVTALLMVAPLCQNDTEITVTRLNEKPYLEITLDWLKRFKIQFENTPDLMSFKVKGGQKYNGFQARIPADFSTATFPLVAAAVTRGQIDIRNLDFSDTQGDKEVFSILESMGMEILRDPDGTKVGLSGKLKGMDIDLNATPDALPAMAVAGTFAEGKTVLNNVPQARIKETDRIACMTCELRKMGARIEEFHDGMSIDASPLHGAELESYGDHRIAMALAIAAMGAEGDSTINGFEAASVTYPGFVDDFKKIGAKFEIA